jgi:CheY-like chemotaxis protein
MTELLAHPPREQIHILVVEDEAAVRDLLTSVLTTAGFSVGQAEDGFAALAEIRRHRPSLILSDLNMPRMTGFELLSVVRRRFPSIHVIAMSGAFDEDKLPEGLAADAYYKKSGERLGNLIEAIDRIVSAKPMPDEPGSDADSDDPALAQYDPPQPQPQPRVALWVARRGVPVDSPHLLLSCPECLRAFPHTAGSGTPMQLRRTPCVYCGASISYALLEPEPQP